MLDRGVTMIRIPARVCLGFLAGGLATMPLAAFDGAQARDKLIFTNPMPGGSGGASPAGGLIQNGTTSEFFGTTTEGGGSGCGGNGCGTVYEVDAVKGGTQTVVYAFQGGSDGANPAASLVTDSNGNLYGTTGEGGGTGCGGRGCGTIFEIASGGKETVLYSFCQQPDCADGANPLGGLILVESGKNKAAGGKVVGMASSGGSQGYGVAFSLGTDGTETVLYSFCQQSNCADGASPSGGLISDKAGNLYGTTVDGGSAGYGTVFEIAAGGTESVLYSFCQQANCADGASPSGGLVMDGSGKNKAAGGKVVGMSSSGGSQGYGVVFSLTSGGEETVLYSFCQQANCADGANPHGGLIMVKSGKNKAAGGKVVGMSSSGGSQGYGVAFSLTTGGTEKVLYSFCKQRGCADGAHPMSGLVSDTAGNLYGTTEMGGGAGCGGSGCGTVFELTP
jgi:uncharacterized repeat protein (TIGR03803 family)